MDKLLVILRNLDAEADFENCVTLIDGGILDSFDIISIIAAIDEEFGITVPAEEIIPENFNSAKALYEMIQRLDEE
ncbi:MAG: phosphopantetheine-binding protein [Oscillospiraceae bacterium]|jgi:acyl carrier protein|nr:phosphopantetheine-binding protein [Oscillospiraceae bacterium]